MANWRVLLYIHAGLGREEAMSLPLISCVAVAKTLVRSVEIAGSHRPDVRGFGAHFNAVKSL